jgi:hypothetical protein
MLLQALMRRTRTIGHQSPEPAFWVDCCIRHRQEFRLVRFALFVATSALLGACTAPQGLLGPKHKGPFRAEDGRCFFVTKAGGRIYDPAAKC